MKQKPQNHYKIAICFSLLVLLALPQPPRQSLAPNKAPQIVETEKSTPQTVTTENTNEQISKNSSSSHLTSSEAQSTGSSLPDPLPVSAITSSFVREYVLGDMIYGDGFSGEPLRTYRTQLAPNDPGSGQWWEAALQLPQAWDISTGYDSTLLAIIDTGFALEHEEFQGRWHTNVAEQGTTTQQQPSKLNCSDRGLSLNQACNLIDENFDGIVDNETGPTSVENPSQLNCTDQSLALDKSCNLIDDDSNGLTDDWRGWDFINYDRSVQSGDVNPLGSDTRHASYVTGVAAANGDNGKGIAGVNWQTKILPLQAIDDNGYGNSLSVARAIRYAVNQGADVISMSLGGSSPDAFLRQTIREAISAGVIVVAASGNDGCNCMLFPANYPEVVAVGALSSNNLPASFSSYGSNLDILAPGTGMYVPSWSATNGTSLYAGGIAGTSLATPLVSAGLATLKGLHPNATPTELLAMMSEVTNRLMLDNANHSPSLGFGAANLNAAYTRATTPMINAQINLFAHIHHGAHLSPASPKETKNIGVYQCAIGTTAVYRLVNGSSVFYSVSLSEIARAQSSGYSATFVTYMCVLQAHDNIEIIRRINFFSEFENRFVKE
jgi:hypothetical protein